MSTSEPVARPTENVVPPMGGLAKMALQLAADRAGPYWSDFAELGCPVAPREETEINPGGNPVSSRYYQIIDRIARGEKP